MFDCIALNGLGSVSSSGELRVLAFAPNFQKNPMVPVLGMVGQSAVMTCQPEAAPSPIITWFFQGTALAPIVSTMDPTTGEPAVSLTPSFFLPPGIGKVEMTEHFVVSNNVLHPAQWKFVGGAVDENARRSVRVPSAKPIWHCQHFSPSHSD